jgi:mRNA interferase MazF
MMAKTRPCVVMSIAKPDAQRNMVVVVPMTTEIRGGECEVSFSKPAWLKQDCVVNVLGIAGVENARIERNLAPFPAKEFRKVEAALKRVLAI